jgi:phosphoribosyl-dephospho-CoA transferase
VGAAFRIFDTSAAKPTICIHVALGQDIGADELLFCRDTQGDQTIIRSRDDETLFICIALAIFGTLKIEARAERFFRWNATGDRASIIVFKSTEISGGAV